MTYNVFSGTLNPTHVTSGSMHNRLKVVIKNKGNTIKLKY